MNESDRYAVATRIATNLYGSSPNNFDPNHYGRIRDNLLRYSDEMLTRLHESIGTEGGELDLIGFLITDGDGESETGVRECLYFMEQVNDEEAYPAVVCNMVQGLHLTSALPDRDDYSTADDLTRRQCVALIHVLITLMSTGVRDGGKDPQKHKVVGNRLASFINDDALVRLVMERAADYERIRQTIKQRKTANPEVILQVLNAPSPTLSDGLL